MANQPQKTPIIINNSHEALIVSNALEERSAFKSKLEDVTIGFKDGQYSGKAAIDALIVFSTRMGWGFKKISTPGELRQLIKIADQAILDETQPKGQEGSIPDYIILPDEKNPAITRNDPQVGKYLNELKTQIKTIEEQNRKNALEERLRASQKTIENAQIAVEEEIVSTLKHRIPKATVRQILKTDRDKFQASLGFAATITNNPESLLEETIYGYAKSSLGGRLLLNQIERTSSQSEAAIRQMNSRVVGKIDRNAVSQAIKTFSDYRAFSDGLTREMIVAGFYDKLQQKNMTESQKLNARNQALKAAEIITALSQTNSPVFLNPIQYHETLIKSFGAGNLEPNTVLALTDGTPGSLTSQSLLIGSFIQNQTHKQGTNKILKKYTIPLSGETDSTAISYGAMGFGLFGIAPFALKSTTNPTQPSDADILISKHLTNQEQEQIMAAGKLLGKSRAYILSVLRFSPEKARLILLANRITVPGTIPREILSAAEFATTPIRSIGRMIAAPIKSALSSASVKVSQLTTKALSWVGVAIPKILKVTATGISTFIKALGPAFAASLPEILTISAVIMVVVLLLPLILNTPISTAHVNPLPPKNAGGGEYESTLSKYVRIEVNPSIFQIDNPLGSISYTYTITPLLGSITINSYSYEATYINNSGESIINMSPSPPQPPSEPISDVFESSSFGLNLSPAMDDSLVVVSITMEITTSDGTVETITSLGTTIVGNPPTGCFILASPPAPNEAVTAINWSGASDASSKEIAASAVIMGAFGGSSDVLCSGPINLYLAAKGCDVNYGGWFLGNGNIALDYKNGSVGSQGNALYTLSHEAGHVYDERSGISASEFRQAGFVYWNGNSCINNIYPFPVYLDNEKSCYSENFAEGFSKYITGSLSGEWRVWFATNVFN